MSVSPDSRRVQRADRRPAARHARTATDLTPVADLEHTRSRTGPVIYDHATTWAGARSLAATPGVEVPADVAEYLQG
jgi:hypothetical protein